MDVVHLNHEEYRNINFMARNLSPKCKICRRAGQKLFLKGERCLTSKCPMLRKPYPPGAHQRHQKLTEYGKQLMEKQKAKRTYGILEKQFRTYVKRAVAKKGDNRENLFRILERRLDNVIFQCGIASSRDMARQIVKHQHLLVNGRRVDVPSFRVKKGDQISFNDKFRKTAFFDKNKSSFGKKAVPGWISFDPEKLEIKIIDSPLFEEVNLLESLGTVIDFYSR